MKAFNVIFLRGGLPNLSKMIINMPALFSAVSKYYGIFLILDIVLKNSIDFREFCQFSIIT